MSRRWQAQSPDGIMQEVPGVGIIKIWSTKTTPTNAAQPNGYAPGCFWFYIPVNGPPQIFVNIGGNGMYVGMTQNTVANWIEYDPTGLGQIQFASGTSPGTGGTGGYASQIAPSGNIYRNVWPTGASPSVAGAKKIVDLFNIPANSFDGTGYRGVQIVVSGIINVTNDNSCTVTINAGATSPTVGSTISTGTDIATTGAQTNASPAGFTLQANILYAASGNVIYQQVDGSVGTSNLGCGSPTELALTLTGAIPICLTANDTTTAANTAFYWWTVQGFN